MQGAVLAVVDDALNGLGANDEPRVTLPNRLVARRAVIPAVEIAAEPGDEQHRLPERHGFQVQRILWVLSAGDRQAAGNGEVEQHGDLGGRQHLVSGQFRRVSAHKRQRREAPCDHCVDGHCRRLFKSAEFRLKAALFFSIISIIFRFFFDYDYDLRHFEVVFGLITLFLRCDFQL